ncbi:mycofactocin-coupled SDR family oxidoreductase [Amycolatopsis methanolica]|uniref:3-oxoacyl-(Acyl-carrier-protein) reductase n=1 Tax=Amycolatopsis methanolica 239 TaxID=1068978 RepID=A0A076MQV0_AMYME|nr:mycofactocin-coupled SDR family oxidoreductase [Amycolatopsis methanolica]AIJ23268.1 3-oxoacyl-(acyl-carrier-protein) reductase [Amycolatopsis methanolica 239]
MTDLTGKVAFITGAARGQGRSHALALARAGAAVVATDCCAQIPTVPYPMSTPDDLAETVAGVEEGGGRGIGVVADVRSRDQLDDAVRQGVDAFGRIDVVIANAGVAQGFPEEETHSPGEIWDDYLAVNLTGAWNTIQATAPVLVEGGRGGSVILINSTSGLKGMSRGDARSDAYTAAKHGQLGLMKAYALELGPHGIRVNCVHPTAVATPMIENPAMKAWVEHNLPRVPSRFGDAMHAGRLQPEEISAAVLWLASDAAKHVTGVSLPVDAGFAVV